MIFLSTVNSSLLRWRRAARQQTFQILLQVSIVHNEEKSALPVLTAGALAGNRALLMHIAEDGQVMVADE